MKILVISLPKRRDRQELISKSLSEVELEFEFVSAKDLSFFNQTYHQSRTVTLYPIWLSHVNAMKQLLATNDEWIFVFEDDADFSRARCINRAYVNHLRKTLPGMSDRIDMFQLGFNEDEVPGAKGLLLRSFFMVFRVLPHDLTLSKRLFSKIGLGGFLHSSLQFSPRFSFRLLVQGHSKRGTHAYIINRRFAEFLVNYFENNFSEEKLLPLDSFLHHLTNMPNSDYKVVRFSKSLIDQSDSPSDNLIQSSPNS
jgi:GR25 family glycosyltransferase involved in LPS biosynthesis